MIVKDINLRELMKLSVYFYGVDLKMLHFFSKRCCLDGVFLCLPQKNRTRALLTDPILQQNDRSKDGKKERETRCSAIRFNIINISIFSIHLRQYSSFDY